MGRILVLANKTLSAPALTAALQARAAEDVEFLLVVPATPPSAEERTLLDSEHIGRGGEGAAQTLARWRMNAALERLRGAGIAVEGRVGDSDPVKAAAEALKDWPADEVLVSTLPRRVSRWLARDLPHVLQRSLPQKVTHLEASKDFVPSTP